MIKKNSRNKEQFPGDNNPDNKFVPTSILDRNTNISYESYESDQFENQLHIGNNKYVPQKEDSVRKSRQFDTQQTCLKITITITILGGLLIICGLLTIVDIYIPIFGEKQNWEIVGVTGVIIPVCLVIAIIVSWVTLKKRLRFKKGIWKENMEGSTGFFKFKRKGTRNKIRNKSM